MKIQPGSTVLVRAYPNQELRRRVVALESRVVLLTTDIEWRTSQAQQRDPVCLGFPIEDIIEITTNAP